MTQPTATRHSCRRRAPHGPARPRTGRVGLRMFGFRAHVGLQVRVGIRMFTAVALLGGSVAFAGLFDHSTAFAADGACEGVTVVVDFTDVGGGLSVACAEGEQESGRAALLAAGFTTTDSQPGLLCAINSMPNPCPETFDGNFWSYWNSTPTSEWASYQVGADSSTPAAGTIEGWRYNDGTTAPGIAPAEVAAALANVTPSTPDTTETPGGVETPDVAPGSDEEMTSTTLANERADQVTLLTVTAITFFALCAALVVFFVVRKRRSGPQTARSAATANTAGTRTAASPTAGPSTTAESHSNDPEARD